MNKLLIIVGPTAIGKTAQALKTAKKFSGQLVNADSRQVYKGLDIISGKDIPQNSHIYSIPILETPPYSIGYYDCESVPLYLTDIVDSSFEFSVSDYVVFAPRVIEYIRTQDSLPIIVGGSGFYVKALLDGVGTLSIPPNKQLREELEKLEIGELQKKLETLNKEKFESMNNSDMQNRRRLIRAIEIATSHELRPQKVEEKAPRLTENYEILIIGLTSSREIIKKRIDERVEKRIQQGAFEEAESLFKRLGELSNQVKTGNGYKQLFEYFQGRVSRQIAIENWRKSEYLNAKKQMTWFGKDARIKWFNISESDYKQQIEQTVSTWIESA